MKVCAPPPRGELYILPPGRDLIIWGRLPSEAWRSPSQNGERTESGIRLPHPLHSGLGLFGDTAQTLDRQSEKATPRFTDSGRFRSLKSSRADVRPGLRPLAGVPFKIEVRASRHGGPFAIIALGLLFADRADHRFGPRGRGLPPAVAHRGQS